jgi:hypothetical protein
LQPELGIRQYISVYQLQCSGLLHFVQAGNSSALLNVTARATAQSVVIFSRKSLAMNFSDLLKPTTKLGKIQAKQPDSRLKGLPAFLRFTDCLTVLKYLIPALVIFYCKY